MATSTTNGVPPMLATSTRRRASRAVAVLASGLLAVGLAQAPSSAGDARDRSVRTSASAPEEDLGLTWDELRDLAASYDPGAGADGAGERRAPRRTAVVTDPRGDAQREGDLRGPRPHTRLADLTRVFYRTPARVDGDLRLRSTWVDHVDASERGVRRQYLLSFLFSTRSDDFWVMWVGNARDRVLVYRLSENGERRVRPERVSVDRSFGPGGTTTVTLSSEWLDTRRVGIGSVGISGFGEEAGDPTRLARVLDVGPVAR